MKTLLVTLLLSVFVTHTLASTSTCQSSLDDSPAHSAVMPSAPCHDHMDETPELDKNTDIQPHLCDCDASGQFIDSTVSKAIPPRETERPYLRTNQHTSIIARPENRPPISIS